MFYGILIMMYYLDNDTHHRPHIHAEYAEHGAVIAIDNGEVFEGELPGSQMKLVQAWMEIHKNEPLGRSRCTSAFAAKRRRGLAQRSRAERRRELLRLLHLRHVARAGKRDEQGVREARTECGLLLQRDEPVPGPPEERNRDRGSGLLLSLMHDHIEDDARLPFLVQTDLVEKARGQSGVIRKGPAKRPPGIAH